MSWHSQPIDDVLRHFSTSRSGLDDPAAQSLLERVGPNRLQPTPPVSALRILGDQFKSVVVYLLIAATGISFALGDHVESIAIAAVLAINTIIGFITELRA
ncbi:MAG TPA: cation-transporting P-type ATPase, partial [Vicinamibacterales bacterium]|nr:cation-transporting P-type ATPase [Vicinamibacterales bacterium]